MSILWIDVNIRKNDPTKRIESKIQSCVRKLKSKITKEKGSKLHPTGSNPGKFYGTAKNLFKNLKTLFFWIVIQS